MIISTKKVLQNKMTNYNTQPQNTEEQTPRRKMSMLKKIALGTVIGIPLLGAGTLGGLLGYEKLVLKPIQDKADIITKIPVEQRTLEQQAYLETAHGWNNQFGQYTLKNHPNLKSTRMEDLGQNYYDECNSRVKK
ncbi:Uncharacterised protein [uncultured archaeon]|nr:Uncharacterised protein [uncultured archaeon]